MTADQQQNTFTFLHVYEYTTNQTKPNLSYMESRPSWGQKHLCMEHVNYRVIISKLIFSMSNFSLNQLIN